MSAPVSLIATALRRALPGWLGLLLCLSWPLQASAQSLLGSATQVRTEQVSAELLAHAPEGAAAGATVWVGLQLTHAPEWHTYWKNSGDSGLPTELQWTLPEGVTAGEIAWPTPRKFPLGTLANYGYDGTVLLPVPLTIDERFQGSELDVGLYAAWLACRKECIPEEGDFRLRIPVQGSTALHGRAFDAAWAAAPRAVDAGGSTLQPEDGFLNVSLAGLPDEWFGQRLEFFPETPGLIEPGSPWTQAWDGGQWTARVPLSPQRSDSPDRVPLVVALVQGRMRNAQLQRRVEGISPKMLAQSLRELERDGLVAREVFPEVPPRVEYELTPLGMELASLMDHIRRWAEAHVPQIEAARAEAAAKSGASL